MVEDAVGLGGFNKDRIPALALGLCAFLLLLSFFVGWYTIEVRVDHWQYDGSQEENKGSQLPDLVMQLHMKMFSIDTSAKPTQFEEQVRQQGEPTYDSHAGRMGTKMLGVFLLQLTALVALVALVGFYVWHRRRDQSETLTRMGVVFMFLAAFAVLYFATTIGTAAQEDTRFILGQYQFEEGASYDLSDVEVGFWKVWQTEEPHTVTVNGQQEVWEVTATSRPDAGWWLEVAALASFAVAAVTHQKYDSGPSVGGGSRRPRAEP
jgi:hypothetical protein